MKKSEQDEMNRLREAVDRLTREAKDLHERCEALSRQLIIEEGKNLAYRELLDKQLASR